MKILFVSHLATVSGGSEKSLLEIIRYLQKKDVTVTVIVPSHGAMTKVFDHENIPFHIIPYSWGTHQDTVITTNDSLSTNLSLLSDIKKTLAQERPDIIVSNTVVVPWFAYVAKTMSIPHLWFIRELAGEAENGIHFYPNTKEYIRFIKNNFNNFVANSHFTANYYRKLLSVEEIPVVKPTIDESILSVYNENKLQNHTLSKSSPIKIIVFGAINQSKNQLEVLRAINRLRERSDKNFQLTILGPISDANYCNEIKNYIHRHKLQSFVSLVGYTDDPYSIVSNHDICIVPSINEPFGRVTIEAMILGKVVIASDSGGNVEIMNDFKDACFYKLGDPDDLAEKINFYLNDTSKIVTHGEAAHTYAVDRFIANNDLNYFHEILTRIKREDSSSTFEEDWLNEYIFDTLKDYKKVQSDLHYFMAENKNISEIIQELRLENEKLKLEVKNIREKPLARILLEKIRSIKKS